MFKLITFITAYNKVVELFVTALHLPLNLKLFGKEVKGERKAW